jgi:hypothetical protein
VGCTYSILPQIGRIQYADEFVNPTGSFPWAECNFFPHPGGCSGSTPFPEVVTPNTVSGKPLKVAYVAVYNKK